MARSGVLRSILRNFLGTYTSRYRDREGYWLFGFLCGGADLHIDLLGDQHRRGDEPREDARLFAVDAFVDQLAKGRVPEAELNSARLTISSSIETLERPAGDSLRTGRVMTFSVALVTLAGALFEESCARFVAPHDPLFERQSVRASK